MLDDPDRATASPTDLHDLAARRRRRRAAPRGPAGSPTRWSPSTRRRSPPSTSSASSCCAASASPATPTRRRPWSRTSTSSPPRWSTTSTSPASPASATPPWSRDVALRIAREVVGDPRAVVEPAPGARRGARLRGRGAGAVRPRRARRDRRPQAPPGRPELRRPAGAARRRAGRRGRPGPGTDAAPLEGRADRRVPGHRPGAVAGLRPGLHRRRDDGAHRRPQAGHLRLPRRRHRDLPPGGRDGGHDPDPRGQLPLRRGAARPAPGAARAPPSSATSGSWCTRSRRPTAAPGSRAPGTRSGSASCGRAELGVGPRAKVDRRPVARPRHPRRRPRDQAAARSAAPPSRAARWRRATSRCWPRAAPSSRPSRRPWPSSGCPRSSARAAPCSTPRPRPSGSPCSRRIEQPHRTDRVRAAALTSFFGVSAADLDAGGDDETDRLADRVRTLADVFAARGVAAVLEATVVDGLTARVLARVGGERTLTDLRHIGEALHKVSVDERLGIVGLLAWLRAQVADEQVEVASERTRRLDSDAEAVQLVTIHGSKGLQYPIVYAPTLWNRYTGNDPDVPLFHDDEGRRARDVGGASPWRGDARRPAPPRGRRRVAAPALRRPHPGPVAGRGLVRPGRAQHARLPAAPAAVRPPARHGRRARRAGRRRRRPACWRSSATGSAAGGPEPELADSPPPDPTPHRAARPTTLAARRFTRAVDTAWRRTSYSSLSAARLHPARRRPVPLRARGGPRARGRRRPRPARPRARRRRSGPRARGRPLADGHPARSARPSARWSTRCSSTPTPAPPTSAPRCWPTSPSSGSGGRSTSTPRSSPTRWSRCAPARWAPSPPSATLLDVASARPAHRARLRAAARGR